MAIASAHHARSPFGALPHFLPYLLGGLIVLGWHLGEWWTFITPVFMFGVVNLADLVLPPNRTAPPSGDADLPRQEGRLSLFSFSPILWPLMQLGFIAWGLWLLTYGELSVVEVIGMVLSIGVMAGAIGITFAHELVHRARLWERIAGELLLLPVTYHHFCVEHVHGHHRTVGTPEDPATARLGESFYAFLPRTLFGGFFSALHLEAARLRRRNRLPFGPRNRVVVGALIEAGLYCAAGFGLGWEGAVGLGAIGFVALFQLEVVNYLEHYGLRRREISPGRYERMTARHSWDDGRRVSGWFLINLQRHADHHLRPGVRYDELTLVGDAPRLPAGYAAMFGAVLIPPLWFAVMNPRVEAERAKEAPLPA